MMPIEKIVIAFLVLVWIAGMYYLVPDFVKRHEHMVAVSNALDQVESNQENDTDKEINDLKDILTERNNNKYKHNIEVKCGVLNSDLLWTTAMEKISNCIDRLEAQQ